MKCLETRATPEGFRRRRYEDDDGTRFTTIEVPMELWDELQLILKHRESLRAPKRKRRDPSKPAIWSDGLGTARMT